jgi:RNA-binding protein PNO1
MENTNNIQDSLEIEDVVETGKNIQEEDEELMDVEIEKVIKNIATAGRQTDLKTKIDYRRILVPMNRMKPLKENWATIVKALVEHMKIQVKMNPKQKCVEIRTCESTQDVSAIQKSEEFLKAFMCGFDLQDSIAMLRLEDLYLETFEIKDGNNFKLP